MKRLILILFCFPFYSHSQGLQFEKGLNDNYLQEIQQMAVKGEFTYVLVKNEYHSSSLEKYDSLGNLLNRQWLNAVPGLSTFVDQRMVITNDGHIWLTGKGSLACDIPQSYIHTLMFDSDCQFITNYSKEIGFNYQGEIYAALSAIDDSSVAVNYQSSDSSWVEILTPTGQNILANVNSLDFFGFGRNSEFHLLGHTVNKIYGIDNQGVLIDSISLPGLFQEIGVWNDTIIVLGFSELYKVAPDLQSFTTHNISNLSNFSRLKVNAQGVRFISSNFNLGVHYLTHHLDLLSVETIPVFSPNNIHFDFDLNLAVGKDFSLTAFKSIRLANYSLTQAQSNSVNRADIAILDIQLYDPTAVLTSSGNVYQVNAKAMVLIKNNGPNSVDSVRLNHHVGQSSSCGEIFTSMYFPNLNLAPGDSTWVDFDLLGAYTDQFFGDSLLREYCIFSSNPNGIVDLNVSNDQACTTQFFGFVGFKESNKLDFQLFPNPSSGTIQIHHANANDLKFSLQDEMGRMILSGELIGNTLELSDVSEGIYFISFQDNKGNISPSKRIVRI